MNIWCFRPPFYFRRTKSNRKSVQTKVLKNLFIDLIRTPRSGCVDYFKRNTIFFIPESNRISRAFQNTIIKLFFY